MIFMESLLKIKHHGHHCITDSGSGTGSGYGTGDCSGSGSGYGSGDDEW